MRIRNLFDPESGIRGPGLKIRICVYMFAITVDAVPCSVVDQDPHHNGKLDPDPLPH
jgi:hypothetical protein